MRQLHGAARVAGKLQHFAKAGKHHRATGLAVIAFAGWSTEAHSQTPDLGFPSGVTGYDQALGVTVPTRLRPLYDPLGIQLDSVSVRPNLEQRLVYDSNPLGISGPGSFISHTSASVAATTQPGDASLGASMGFDHAHYFSLPVDYTDFNGNLFGAYTVGIGQVAATYSHQSAHVLGTTLATTQSTTPTLDQTEIAQLAYAIRTQALTITPELNAGFYRYGDATVAGIPTSQKFLDRDVLAGGVTTRFAMTDESGFVLSLRGTTSHYINRQPGQPSNNSTSAIALAGVDYQAKGPWRFRLLAGGEVRTFAASQYATRVAPTVEGSVIWTPTGLTTLTGLLSRTINDPQSSDTNGYVLTSARLRVDHELRRNVLLQGHAGLQVAQFLQGGGNQNSVNFGFGATWLLNRNVRLSVDYDYTKQSGGGTLAATSINAISVRSGKFTDNLIGVTIHFAL